MRKQYFLLSVLLLLGLLTTVVQQPQTLIYSASGADGTAGTLEIGVTSILDDQPVTIRCYDLTVSGDFTLDFTSGCASQLNFTTGAEQTEFIHITPISEPSGGICTVTLEAQSTGTALDTLYLSFYDVEDVIPTDMLITIGIAVFVVFVIVGIVVGVRKSARAG